MKWVGMFLLTLLVIYSAALFVIDLQLGQNHVRGFFSDIMAGADYPLPYRALYGINTSLMVVLLSANALFFLVCAGVSEARGISGARRGFEWSQVLFFLYLACDERLLIHEKMGSILQMNDAIWILSLGIAELLLLFIFGEVARQPWRLKGWLLAAAAFFGVMVYVDAFLPSAMPGRLPLEDLSKTWATVFLLVYSWNYCMESIIPFLRGSGNES